MIPQGTIVDRPPRLLAQLAGIPKTLQYKVAAIGFKHLTRGKLQKARGIFQGLAELDPYDAWFQLALGSVAQREGNLPEADAAYSRALKLNPNGIAAFANRGEVRLLAGRREEGMADLRRAVSLDRSGRDPNAMRARAVIEAMKRQPSMPQPAAR